MKNRYSTLAFSTLIQIIAFGVILLLASIVVWQITHKANFT